MRFADNCMISVEGIGKVRFTCKDGKVDCMNDVLYVLSMKNNVVKLVTCTRIGKELKDRNSTCKSY